MKYKHYISYIILLFAVSLFGQTTKFETGFSDISSSLFQQDEFSISPSLILIKNDSSKVKAKRDVPWFVERFSLSAGFYETMNNTNIRVGTNSGKVGSEIDFEDDLGFNRFSPTFSTDLQWRASSRSKFKLSYYNIRRKANYKLDRTIDFGENTYAVDADVSVFFNTAVYRFSYGYAILSKPKYEIGMSIGAHIIGAGVGMSLNSSTVGINKKQDLQFTAPLPNLGIWAGYAFTERFALNTEFDYLALKINNTKGQVIGYSFTGVYKIAKNFNLTGGLTGLNLKVDTVRDKLNGHFRWGNNGFSIKASYTFGKKNWL
jgi:hypothetical protein